MSKRLMPTRPNFLAWARVSLAVTAAALSMQVLASEYDEVDRLMQAGQFPEAMAKADGFLKERPRDPQMRFLKAVIQLDTGKRAEAIAAFTQLTQDAPELPEPYNNLAVIYASQNQFDKARGALEAAIRTNPSYATAQENLGDVYARLASQAYSKALQLGQNDAAVQPKLAVIRSLFTPAATGVKPATQLVAAAPVAAPPVPAAPVRAPAAPAPAPAPAAKPVQPPAVAAKERAAPATASAPADRAAPSASAGVEAAVRAWAAAWAGQDMDNYLAAYDADFTPVGGKSRKEWEEERRVRIVGKTGIQVDIENLAVNVSGSTATAKFRQIYRADGLNIRSSKTLEFRRTGTQWQIRKESVGG